MDVSKVRSWVRQFNEGRTSCDNKPKQPRARTSRSDDMIKKVERIVLGDRRMTVEQIASRVGISVGSVHTILHDDPKMRKVSSRWVPRMLTDDHMAARVACCQALLTHDDSMNGTSFSLVVTMDETWMPFFNPETKRQSAQWKHRDSLLPKKFWVTTSADK
ncbi:protein GVQW3-like [Schistocerca gregaria]|uniref:protein GVQW3-like n=1 Tax=Schistocerca gregaria TaxID=7010 RepID=UPI00211F2E43|nr:protein GVQW3-like [Schistocerca gregaria]